MNGFYWLASYPKSGNTWLRLFLDSLATDTEIGSVNINALNSRSGHCASRSNFDRVLDIDSEDLTNNEITNARPRLYEIEAQQACAPLLRKVHDMWGFTSRGEPIFPPELTLGAIYIVRDPRDVAVSMAHHMNESIDRIIDRMGDCNAMTEQCKSRMPTHLPQHLSSWSQHVASWRAAPIRLLCIQYENMLDKPLATFSQIANFLGISPTTSRLQTAINAVSFDKLRAAEEANGFIEKPQVSERFFRRGIAGGWKDSLSSTQIARIERDHADMMLQLGYL